MRLTKALTIFFLASVAPARESRAEDAVTTDEEDFFVTTDEFIEGADPPEVPIGFVSTTAIDIDDPKPPPPKPVLLNDPQVGDETLLIEPEVVRRDPDEPIAIPDEGVGPVLFNTAAPPETVGSPLANLINGGGGGGGGPQPGVPEEEEVPIALPSITSVGDGGPPQQTVGSPLANLINGGGGGGFGPPQPEADFAFTSAAPEDSEPKSCNKEKEGGDVDVAFESPSAGCTSCRSFEGKADTTGTCEPPGSLGWELSYAFGASRFGIRVVACPDMDLVVMELIPGGAGADVSPFTNGEKAYLTKLADEIEAGTAVDVSIKGSLDALAVDVTRALANWPDDKFGLLAGGFSLPTTETIDWFNPDDLTRKDRCSFGPAGGGDTVAPPPPAPTDPPVTKAPQPLPTNPPIFKNSPKEIMPSPTSYPTPTPSSNPTSQPTDSPSIHPTDCIDVCHVTSDGNQLSLVQECLPPSERDANFALYPCDYVITPNCGCNEIGSMNEFRTCVSQSETSRPDCPLDDPIDRIDDEGRLKPVVPTPAPTDCVEVCHLEGHYNDQTGTRFMRATHSCLSPDDVQDHLASHGCDWIVNELCDCSEGFDETMFETCKNHNTCPSFDAGRLDDQGVVRDDPVCTRICHVFGPGLSLRSQCLEPTFADEHLASHPCDYEIEDGTPCVCDGTITFDDIRNCAGLQSCPNDAPDRLTPEGTLDDPVPTPSPSAGCVHMCHIEYSLPTGDSGDTRVEVNVFPQCNRPDDVESLLASNDCDWIVENRDECDCLSSIGDPDALQTMLNVCSPQDCPAREENITPSPTPARASWCHLEFVDDNEGGIEVIVEEREYLSRDEAEAAHDGHPCDWEVAEPDCPCIVDGTFDVNLVGLCAPDTCPQKQAPAGRRTMLQDAKVWVV